MCCVIKYILSLLLVCKYAALESSDCPSTSSLTSYSKLKYSILCDYDAYIRPVADHRNATKLYFQFFVRYFTYYEATNTLGLDVWMRISWVDEHLKWNPDEYDKIDIIYLKTSEIWTPDISVFNRATQGGDPTLIEHTTCPLFSNGTVFCVPSVHIDSLCIPDLSLYPYDTQECVMRVGSWIYKGRELDLILLKNVVVLAGMEPNGDWEIKSFTKRKYSGNYPSIEITFKLKRLHGAHAASIVLPIVVLVIITFTSLAMSPANEDRLRVCYINLIIHFLHMNYISWIVPLKGDNIPFIILFGRDSLLMAALALAFTVLFRKMAQWKILTPVGLSSIISFATRGAPGRYLFLSDNFLKDVTSAKGEEDGHNIINVERKMSSDWEIFVKILDFLLFICYIVAYFVMSLRFIPQP